MRVTTLIVPLSLASALACVLLLQGSGQLLAKGGADLADRTGDAACTGEPAADATAGQLDPLDQTDGRSGSDAVLEIPGELAASEPAVAPEASEALRAARLLGGLLLDPEADDKALAEWYRGTPIEELIRLDHRLALVHEQFLAPSAAADPELSRETHGGLRVVDRLAELVDTRTREWSWIRAQIAAAEAAPCPEFGVVHDQVAPKELAGRYASRPNEDVAVLRFRLRRELRTLQARLVDQAYARGDYEARILDPAFVFG